MMSDYNDTTRTIQYLETLNKDQIIEYVRCNFGSREIKEENDYLREPKIHSHIEDALDEDDPLAYEDIYCVVCECMCHCSNNECMQTWIETGKGNYCFECFVRWDKKAGKARRPDKKKIHNVLQREFGLMSDKDKLKEKAI